jgi:RecB family endonuclease NucS
VIPGARLIAREFPTDLGPVDFLLRGRDGATLVVEVKRVAEIAAVEQLTRYVQRLRRDPTLTPVRGVLAAHTIKPQARTLASAREIDCVEVDFDALAGRTQAEQTLF